MPTRRLATWQHRGDVPAVLSGLYVVLLLSTAACYMTPALFRSWYFSSDEYVFAAEVIRFLHLDFRQQFFDIPGTPFMFLSAILWGMWYGLSYLAGPVPAPAGLERFTFDHIAGLFVLMRSLTLLFFLCSLVLVFVVASRLTNRVGGCVASFLVATSPIYAAYSSLVRTESLAVCLSLAALLCLLPRGGAAGQPARVFLAGLLAGLAAGARLHSITMTAPLLLILVILTCTPMLPYPRWVWWFWAGSTGSILVFSARSVALLIATAVTAMVGCLGYALGVTRSFVMRVIGPPTVRLLIGVALGLAIGIPTMLPQWRHFMQSFVMYTTTYRDFDREGLPFLVNVWWFVNYYLSVIAPDRGSLLLLVGGGITVLSIRDSRLLAVLAGAALFFVSKPLNLRAAPHHVILWLPLFAVVSACPIAKAWELRSRVRGGLRRLCYVLVLIAVVATLMRGLEPGFKRVGGDVAYNEQRMQNIAAAGDWIKRNTETNSVVAVAYFCFGPNVFYTWLRALRVPVPDYLLDGREYVIWWGNRSALRGKAGYALATRDDVSSLKQRTDEVSPGDGTDPFTDKSFTLLKSFGGGSNAVNLFRFSLR
jgi:dolichyl-phosphate-mannose-protein mannosyltransferase